MKSFRHNLLLSHDNSRDKEGKEGLKKGSKGEGKRCGETSQVCDLGTGSENSERLSFLGYKKLIMSWPHAFLEDFGQVVYWGDGDVDPSLLAGLQKKAQK